MVFYLLKDGSKSLPGIQEICILTQSSGENSTAVIER